MEQIKKISTLVLATCLILSSFVSNAHADWTPWKTIRRILVHHNSLEITLEGDSNCNQTYRLNTSESNYDVKASALLSAYYAGHEVSVDYSGSLNSCRTPLHRLKVRP